MSTSLTGNVRGNTIEFARAIGLPDGQVVAVTLEPVSAPCDTDEHLRATFEKFAEEWKISTGHLSNISQKVRHPAYQAILAMGKPAVPFILRELETTPNDWFPALMQITGEDPVPEDSYGVVEEMAEAWLGWARAHGHVYCPTVSA